MVAQVVFNKHHLGQATVTFRTEVITVALGVKSKMCFPRLCVLWPLPALLLRLGHPQSAPPPAPSAMYVCSQTSKP